MKIEFSSDHNKTNEKKNCQLFVAMTGDKEFIKERLKQLLDECNDSYGKPKQGIICCWNGTVDIVTPIWNGKQY